MAYESLYSQLQRRRGQRNLLTPNAMYGAPAEYALSKAAFDADVDRQNAVAERADRLKLQSAQIDAWNAQAQAAKDQADANKYASYVGLAEKGYKYGKGIYDYFNKPDAPTGTTDIALSADSGPASGRIDPDRFNLGNYEVPQKQDFTQVPKVGAVKVSTVGGIQHAQTDVDTPEGSQKVDIARQSDVNMPSTSLYNSMSNFAPYTSPNINRAFDPSFYSIDEGGNFYSPNTPVQSVPTETMPSTVPTTAPAGALNSGASAAGASAAGGMAGTVGSTALDIIPYVNMLKRLYDFGSGAYQMGKVPSDQVYGDYDTPISSMYPGVKSSETARDIMQAVGGGINKLSGHDQGAIIAADQNMGAGNYEQGMADLGKWIHSADWSSKLMFSGLEDLFA